MQIIIQSNQENLSENIQKLEEKKIKEISSNNLFMVNIFNQYIHFIQEKNKEKIATVKTFYIIINSNEFPENQSEKAMTEIREKYFKIKDTLARCGNQIEEIKNIKEIKKIMKSFLYQKGSDYFEN